MTDFYSNMNTGTRGIQNMQIPAPKTEEVEEPENTAVQNEVKPEKPQINEKDLFSFMANGAMISQINVKLSPAALIARYNSPEQIARIESTMAELEAQGNNIGMPLVEAYFSNIPAFQEMSEANKNALALSFAMHLEENVGESIGQMFSGVADSVIEGLAGY